MRVRLLPATIAVGSLLLATKAAQLGGALWPAILPVSMAVVAPAEAAPAPPPPPPPRPASYARAAPAAPPPAAAPSQPPEPAVTEAEKQLLGDLRARRLELEARDRTLAQRQAVLDAAEQRLTARVAELGSLQARLEGLEAERRLRDAANWAGLVKMYETMKPRDAAGIFNDMDMPVLLQVVDRMKDTKAAPVLAAMQPDRARLLTTQLAAQRTRSVTLPGAGPAG